MEIFYALFLAVANNLDTVGVRIAYSLKGIQVPLFINLWIAAIAFVISSVAAGSGMMVAFWLPGKFADYLSMILFLLIGLWLIFEPYWANFRKSTPENVNMLDILADPIGADRDQSKHIDFKEATVLGLALSLNNIGGGLTAGVLGVHWAVIGLLSAVLSFLIFWAGNRLSDFLKGRKLSHKVSVVAGILLILIGLWQVF